MAREGSGHIRKPGPVKKMDKLDNRDRWLSKRGGRIRKKTERDLGQVVRWDQERNERWVPTQIRFGNDTQRQAN